MVPSASRVTTTGRVWVFLFGGESLPSVVNVRDRIKLTNCHLFGASVEAQSKRVWIVTLANIAFICLWLRAFDWDWLFSILPFIGLALSVTGLRFTTRVESRASRRFAFVVNGCALVLDLVIILALATSFSDTKAHFLVPDGYEGDVYVVEARDGEPSNETFWGTVTYRIPRDGILRTQKLSFLGVTTLTYYYERHDGTLEAILGQEDWMEPQEFYHERQDGSLEYTLRSYEDLTYQAENSENDRDIGRFGIFSGFTDCAGNTVSFQHFYVGTKAHLLSKYRRIDFGRYFRDHPIGCSERLPERSLHITKQAIGPDQLDFATPVFAKKKEPVQYAPLPAKALAAKTIYIQNDSGYAEMLDKASTSLKAWGRYQLVDAKEKADLILLLKVATEQKEFHETVSIYNPETGWSHGTVPTPSTYAWTFSQTRLIDPATGDTVWADDRAWIGKHSATEELIKGLRERIEEQEKGSRAKKNSQ